MYLYMRPFRGVVFACVPVDTCTRHLSPSLQPLPPVRECCVPIRTFLVQYPGGMSLKCVHQLHIFDYSVTNHALDVWQIKSSRMREEDS